MTLKALALNGRKYSFISSMSACCVASFALLTLAACFDSSGDNLTTSACIHASIDENGETVNRTLGVKQNAGVLYFKDVVPLDKYCSALFPVADFKDHSFSEELRTDDTERVQRALYAASQVDRNEDGIAEGGIVYLKKSHDNGANIYRLSRLNVPSNIRVVIDPEVTLVMIGGEVSRRAVNGDLLRGEKGDVLTRKNQHMFAIGNSEFTTALNPNRIENVEITSSRPGEMFTIDQRTEFPTAYTIRRRGQLRSGKTPVPYDNPQEYGVTSEFAAPFFIGYAKNVSVSDVNVLDNYTYLPPVAIFADSNMKDGVVGAKRHVGSQALDANGLKLMPRMLVDDEGNKVTDASAYERNSSYGRVLTQGAFVNIQNDRGHGGFGTFQIWGGDTVYVRDLHGVGGITVRLEPGAGVENISRSGPEFGTIHTVEMDNISVRDGYAAVWLKPHSKDNYNIKVSNLAAYDSGAALIMDTTSQDDETFPDLHKGAFSDVKISGVIHFAREDKAPRAEVGYIPTLAMHPKAIAEVRDVDGYTDDGIRSGKADGQITTTDLQAGPSGDRWFLVDPIAPIIAFNQMSGKTAAEKDSQENTSKFYDFDVSEAKFTRGGAYPIHHSRHIIYREDMKRLSDGKPAVSMINK